VVIHNVPRIRDVEAMLALLDDLGVRVEWRAENTVALQADQVRGTDTPSAPSAPPSSTGATSASPPTAGSARATS
jgi:UDP-N-acetylglucosamine enolpyruvyl transferase